MIVRNLIYIILILSSVQTLWADIIEESGSLKEFLSGTEEGIAYDNFFSHISEGIVDTGYNDYGPVWFDIQSNDFGDYSVIEEGSSILSVWDEILTHFIREEYSQADELLSDSLETFRYDLVFFQDTVLSRNFVLLRERLDSTYVDNNNTVDPNDDVVGSFQNGWGLYILNPDAVNKNLVLQVPHPCDDFVSPYVAMEIFLQCDAFAFQIAGAGREVRWTEEGSYNNNKSLSDPSRNSNTVFHLFHKVVTDSLESSSLHSPVVMQIHSFDNESHQDIIRSVVLSGGWDASLANKPIRDLSDSHQDIVNLTQEYPIAAGEYGDHPELHVTYYYQVHYDGNFDFVGDTSTYSVPHTYQLLGIITNEQLSDLHSGFNHGSVYEPFVHVELDEKPMIFDAMDWPMEEMLFQDLLPVTWRNFDIYSEYYSHFVDAVNAYFTNWTTVPDTIAPLKLSSVTLNNFTSTNVELSWNPVFDSNFKTYRIYYDTSPDMDNPQSMDHEINWALENMLTGGSYVVNLISDTSYYFQVESEDYFSNVSERSDIIMAITSEPDNILNFDMSIDTLYSWQDQDGDSLSWMLSDSITYGQSDSSLFLYGNTWKYMDIDPYSISENQVWQIAVHSDGESEIQGFGVEDSVHSLFYSFAGSQELDIEEWVTVYQGNFPDDQWNLYQIPIADDWFAWYDYFPVIDKLVFFNDADGGDPGHVFFDHLVDLTAVLPVAPDVSISYEIGERYRLNGLRQVDVQFFSEVLDWDTYSHDYFWSFGDDSTSAEVDPVHSFLIEDDHSYTVFLEVTDQTGRAGFASVQISVGEGESSFPLTMNFVGDIILARNYENDGGIIPTLGVEAIFEPTLSILGENADITVVNLEAPLTTSNSVHPTKPIVFKGSPDNVSGLVYAGVDIVTLANNHVMDYMLPGIEETMQVLSDNNILSSGAGANSIEAYQPIFFQKKGVNIAFLANSDRTGQYNNYQPYLNAGYNKIGFAYLTPYYMLQQIESVQADADLIVVEMHAGSEYSTAPGYGYDSFTDIMNPDSEPSQYRDIDANDVAEDENYSPYLDIPHMWDREIRHFAIDSGADLVIVHHPHIIQGVEVYNGKLIAHSLGNFVFDLSYPETFPSMILQSKIDETGFYEFTIDPVIIDDYIPVPALGELGTHILDDLAMKSKALNTTLHIDRELAQARVMMDTLLMPQTTVYNLVSVSLNEMDTLWISDPVKLNRNGFISSVEVDTSLVSMKYRVGKERVWMGNMENEGFSFWNINSDWEYFDDSVAFRGERSIQQVRTSSMGDNVVTNFEKRLLIYPEKEYSIHGWIKTENGGDVTLQVRSYSSRTGGNIIETESVSAISGFTDWTYSSKDFVFDESAKFIDYRLSSDVPDDSTALSWFDDVGLIEWGEWKSISESEITSPNDLSFLQFKSTENVENFTAKYIETVYDDISPVSPNFMGDIISGYFPLNVQFTETSNGITTYREWDFGDGITSTMENPQHLYSEPGMYSVSLTVPDYSGNLTTFTRENYIHVSDTSTVEVDYIDDWNLVSLPSIVVDSNVGTIFPTAIEGTLFRFDESYFPDSLLAIGAGYWLRFESGGNQEIIGSPLQSIDLDLIEGWNLVQGIGSVVSLESIIDPDNIIVPNTLFGFNLGYFDSDILESGKGYWLRCFASGTITLANDGRLPRENKALIEFESSGWISAGNMKLHFGVESLEDLYLSCSVPPLPPQSAFDIRFENSLRCGEDSISVLLKNNVFPLEVNYELSRNQAWKVLTETGEKFNLTNEGTITIVSPINSFQLFRGSSLPDEFRLYPNYPNPFNHKTIIKYDLPKTDNVSISIFNVRGELVSILIDDEKNAGFHQVEWNGMMDSGDPLSSGMYFVHIETSKEFKTGKLILLK